MGINRKRKGGYRLPQSLADEAMKKLYHDEELSQQELKALFQSDYLKLANNSHESEKSVLYEPTPMALALSSNILLIDTELEILAYFARYPEMLYSIPPRKFEELVASIFKNNGFQVTLTPETRDGGIDIFAVQHNIITGSTLHLIECKRFLPENKVSIGVVQRLMGVVEQH